jgi:hypothetical protein
MPTAILRKSAQVNQKRMKKAATARENEWEEVSPAVAARWSLVPHV